MLNNYIDLTNPSCDLSRYRIETMPNFNCALLDDAEKPNEYTGFLLAKSKNENAYTICDINFHYSEKDKKYAPRLVFKRTFKNLQVKTVKTGQAYQRISFNAGQDGYREFWKMIAFLEKFKETVDIGEFFDEFRVASKNDIISSLKKVKQDERVNYALEIIEKAQLNTKDFADLLALKERQRSIRIFELLMKNEEDYRRQYRNRHKIKKPGDEAIWHHFFKENKWIFGLNLDLRFTADYLDEQSLGNPNTSNNGNPTVDYMGIGSFTTLVEIKTPEKKFFKANKETGSSRANTWSFSNDFIDSVSQCLGQKDVFLKNIQNKDLVDETGLVRDKRLIRTIDPKVILIYGNKTYELPDHDQSMDIFTKKDTLERYIRDSRNLTIISFDELFSRASEIAKLPLEATTTIQI